MITRTERYFAYDVIGAVQTMEAAGWRVRLIVVEPGEEGYSPWLIVVFERDV